jgi:hypothetical protein
MYGNTKMVVPHRHFDAPGKVFAAQIVVRSAVAQQTLPRLTHEACERRPSGWVNFAGAAVAGGELLQQPRTTLRTRHPKKPRGFVCNLPRALGV